MEFLNFALLGGAALAAVPVILHLVMRQQPKHLEFPALRFIQIRKDANRRRMKLRHILLLILRALAICLLAGALARPSIQSSRVLGDQEAPVACAMIFDTAPRMEYRHENQTRLESARKIAQWLMPQLPAESDVAILDGSDSKPVFQIDLGAAKQRIARLETTFAGQPVWKSLLAACDLLEQSKQQRKEIYIFTDLARNAWQGDQSGRIAARLKQLVGFGIYVIDVGVEKPQNFTLGEIRLSSQILPRNSPLTIASDLAATGADATRTVEVYLQDAQGISQMRDQTVVQVAAGQAQAVEFVLGGMDEGTHQGFLKIVGADGLTVDDTRYFSVQLKRAWKVLIVATTPTARHAWYLTQALAPSDWRKTGQAEFECDVVSYGKLPERKLEEYAGVCLLDPAPLHDAVWQQLSAYAQAGGAVAIFLGAAAQPHQEFNKPAAQELLAAPLDYIARFPDGDCFLNTDLDQHVMLARFRPLRTLVPWEDLPVFRYWQLGKLAEGVLPIVYYNHQKPALLERIVGKGRVLTMTTPVSEPADTSDDSRWNMLLSGIGGWPFFMLTNEMMLYLVGSTDTRLNYGVGEPAALHLEQGQRFPTFLLLTPRGDELRQSVDVEQSTLMISSTDVPGNYRLRAGDESAGVDLGFSTNLPIEASQLTRLAPDDLKAILGDTEYRLARSRDEIDRDISRGRVGQELFPILIVLLAICLAGEHLLSNRFYRER